jgi:hypothetical protein
MIVDTMVIDKLCAVKTTANKMSEHQLSVVEKSADKLSILKMISVDMK